MTDVYCGSDTTLSDTSLQSATKSAHQFGLIAVGETE